MRVKNPNFTLIPDVFFDELKTFSDGEIRIILVLLRHRDCNQTNLSFLVKKTGMKEQSVFRCLNLLIEKGDVKKEIDEEEELLYSLDEVIE